MPIVLHYFTEFGTFGSTYCQVVSFRLDGSLLFIYFHCCLPQVKILGVTCARYESRSEICSIYYMFYASSSATGDRSSYVCRGNDLTHFTRQLLDHRTTKLVSQMRQTDEVYSVKQRRRRSSQSYSLAADPLETIDPTLFGAPRGEKLEDDEGSGEPMIPADEITEGVVDRIMLPSSSGSHNTPYAKVVYPQHSATLRTFCLIYYHCHSFITCIHTFIHTPFFYQPVLSYHSLVHDAIRKCLGIVEQEKPHCL